jgi:hypothetical protein
MTELLYTAVKCKKMADELSHFILSIRACDTGGGARPVREAGEALSVDERGTQRRHAREAGWMARSVDSLVGSTFGFR